MKQLCKNARIKFTLTNGRVSAVQNKTAVAWEWCGNHGFPTFRLVLADGTRTTPWPAWDGWTMHDRLNNSGLYKRYEGPVK